VGKSASGRRTIENLLGENRRGSERPRIGKHVAGEVKKFVTGGARERSSAGSRIARLGGIGAEMNRPPSRKNFQQGGSTMGETRRAQGCRDPAGTKRRGQGALSAKFGRNRGWGGDH